MAEGIKRTRDRWRIRGETREDDLIYNYEESRAKKSLFGTRNIIYLIGLMKGFIGIWVIEVMTWNRCLF